MPNYRNSSNNQKRNRRNRQNIPPSPGPKYMTTLFPGLVTEIQLKKISGMVKLVLCAQTSNYKERNSIS